MYVYHKSASLVISLVGPSHSLDSGCVDATPLRCSGGGELGGATPLNPPDLRDGSPRSSAGNDPFSRQALVHCPKDYSLRG